MKLFLQRWNLSFLGLHILGTHSRDRFGGIKASFSPRWRLQRGSPWPWSGALGCWWPGGGPPWRIPGLSPSGQQLSWLQTGHVWLPILRFVYHEYWWWLDHPTKNQMNIWKGVTYKTTQQYNISRWKYWLFANELQSFGTEMLVNKYIIFFGQNFEFTTIVLLPRASHPDTQMTEVISLRSNRAKDCPGKSNSFPQKFAKILTFTGVIYDFI